MSDRTSSRMRNFGLYGRYARGASRLSLLGGVSTVENTTFRTVTDGVSTAAAHAAYDAQSIFSRIAYGHAIGFRGHVTLEPQAGFQYARLSMDGLAEEGAGVLSLIAPERRTVSKRSTLGGRVVKSFGASPDTGTRVEIRGAWAHEFDGLSTTRMRFAGDTASNPFDLSSPSQ